MSKELDDKVKAKLSNIARNYSKKFGKDSLTFAKDIVFAGSVVPTGSLLLDQATGIGGIPIGYVAEIYGLSSSGKTTLAATIVAQAQKLGLVCAYVDPERAVSPTWFATLGVDVSKLIYVKPDSFEDSINKTELLASSGCDLIVYDSIASAVPIAEMEGDAGTVTVGLKARMMGMHIRKMISILDKNKCGCIYINQTRSNIVAYGNPEARPASVAVEYAAGLIIKVSKKPIKEKSETIGDTISARIVKNRIGGIPGKVVELSLIYGKGFDTDFEIAKLAVELGFIEKTGAWYRPVFLLEDGITEDEVPKYQGIENMYEAIKESPENLAKLTKMVRDNLEKVKITDKEDTSEDTSGEGEEF